MTPAVIVDSLEFRYGARTVFSGISFSIAAGESVGLAGPNGAGKSTLLWCLMGLLRPHAGRAEIRVPFGAVLQNPEDQLFMPSILEDAALPLQNRGLSRQQALQRAREALAAVGLDHAAGRPGHALSAGERKRAALACALALQPGVLLLDEPTSELDPRSARVLAAHLDDLQCAKFIASHDLPFLRRTTSRLLILDEGLIVADGPAASLLADEALLLSHGLK
ncbi:MAG: putative ABC transporter ATP-binding protein [Bryobacteraceae bacterium]|jgi:cobalt/nickel transport system ATP-binding protein|nr:MAG: putative ABC transporter ATP-binding protein [Bryobacteraceae bacterium]